jgi:hypothetical protein
LAGVSSPSGRATTVEWSTSSYTATYAIGHDGGCNGTSAAVKARSRSANVVHHFTIGAGKSFGTLAQIFIRFGILASAAIVT